MKKFLLTASTFLILVNVTGCNRIGGNGSTNQSSSSSQASVAASIPAGWSVYSGMNLFFAYPEDQLELDDEDESIILSHGVPYTHPDPCDFRGDGTILDEVTDFHLTIEQTGATLIDAVSSRMHWTAPDKELFITEDGKDLRESEGFIEVMNFDNVSGYVVLQGVEGCGQFIYFLENEDGNVVILTDKYVTELSGVLGDTSTYESLPGIILPPQHGDILNGLLNTLSVQ